MKFILLTIIFSNLILAQDSLNTGKKEPKHGIQFQVDSWLTLSNFNGLTFSYRYLLNKTSGLRIGLYTNFQENDENMIREIDTLYHEGPRDIKDQRFLLSAEYIYRTAKWNDFCFILGAGPFISYRNNRSIAEYLYADSPPYIRISESRQKSSGFGLKIISGAEYNISENFVISGEYGIEFSKQNTDILETHEYITLDKIPFSTTKTSGTRTTLQMLGMQVKLGVTVFL